MRKISIIILLIISIASFFILLNVQDINEFNNMKSSEINDKSYNITIGNEVDTIPSDETYNNLIKVLDKYSASIYRSTISFVEDEPILIKYIYSDENYFFEKFNLKNGEMLNQNDENPNRLIATFETGDKNQIGTIYDFRFNNKMIITTLESAINKISFSGDYIVNLKNSNNIDEFINELMLELNSNVVRKDIDVDKGFNFIQAYITILLLYFILILIILYKLLNSYKEFGIKKMLGFTTKDIWLKDIKGLIVLQIIINIFVNILMFIIILKGYSNYLNDFIIKTCMTMGIQLILSFVFLSIPYIYIYKITISNMIKDKKNIKSLVTFNFIIKTILLIIFILSSSVALKEYYSIKSFYNVSFENWEETKDYAYIGGIKAKDYDEFKSEEFNLKLKELYFYLNDKGSILADFNEFDKKIIEENKKANIPEAVKSIGTINPNYLINNKVYDIENKEISISESEIDRIIIVPYRYKESEEEIKKYFSYLEKDIRVIWSKDNQNVFSYNMNINPEYGNMVESPLLMVITEKNGETVDYSKVAGYLGNPFKMKVNDIGNPKGTIKDKAEEIGIYNNLINVYSVYDEVSFKVYELNQKLLIISFGILLCMMIIIFIILQNIFNYFEQNKQLLAIKNFHGYKYYDKYRDYYLKILYSWIIVVICIIIIKPNDSWFIFLGALGLEIIISTISIKKIEKRNIIKVIKKG